MFEDRTDAGIQLSQALIQFKKEDVVVLAIPRGGLPLGSIVAKKLQAPLDVVLTKKIGHPYHREYAIGAVSLENMILSNAVGVTKNYIEEEAQRIRQKLRKRQNQYYKNRMPENLKNKIVIIVDDGIATGNTILVTAELVKKQQPKKIVIAVPVASKSAIKKIKSSGNVDEVICLQTPFNFKAVGQFYLEFHQVSDKEAIQLLEESYVNGI
ncbi:phosphoribosyltransferase [Flagellimonas aquimarina]|jgi:putative phosphoribosyl transferase|uniref:Phosphoribosyltransferase n=1 Tax=Flagellimonas aquimarina TaxID=2201895 RepID=A0A316L1J0_9FLAO|nr:phosphoribosyltransferase family protein [Allomuricauda koreensis]PWL40387.1 phosphoribosyltransferase [Allomuricauda koreensis]